MENGWRGLDKRRIETERDEKYQDLIGHSVGGWEDIWFVARVVRWADQGKDLLIRSKAEGWREAQSQVGAGPSRWRWRSGRHWQLPVV